MMGASAVNCVSPGYPGTGKASRADPATISLNTVVDGTNALGEFLRARRDLLRPEDVGLVAGGRRRVPGLRREELAMLAGVSPDYYVRLEQGRDHHPSVQVLDTLATVLQLDPAATAYLHELGRPKTRRRARPRVERVPVGIAQLLEQLPMPAFVTGRYLDILARQRHGPGPLAQLSRRVATSCGRSSSIRATGTCTWTGTARPPALSAFFARVPPRTPKIHNWPPSSASCPSATGFGA
jgi:transcriptional regulator with XRE-family HTH domain